MKSEGGTELLFFSKREKRKTSPACDAAHTRDSAAEQSHFRKTHSEFLSATQKERNLEEIKVYPATPVAGTYAWRLETSEIYLMQRVTHFYLTIVDLCGDISGISMYCFWEEIPY